MTIQNRNKPKRANATSKYIGVSWSNKSKLWQIGICVNKKRISLGLASDEKIAANIRDQYILDNKLVGFTLNFNRENPYGL